MECLPGCWAVNPGKQKLVLSICTNKQRRTSNFGLFETLSTYIVPCCISKHPHRSGTSFCSCDMSAAPSAPTGYVQAPAPSEACEGRNNGCSSEPTPGSACTTLHSAGQSTTAHQTLLDGQADGSADGSKSLLPCWSAVANPLNSHTTAQRLTFLWSFSSPSIWHRQSRSLAEPIANHARGSSKL